MEVFVAGNSRNVIKHINREINIFFGPKSTNEVHEMCDVL